MEITSDIHRIDGIRGGNCYLVLSDSKMLVVDTGMPGSAKKIISYIRSLNKNPADVSYIVMTHADIDHIGSASELKQMTGASLAIHAADAPILAGKSRFKPVWGPLGILVKLFIAFTRFQPIEPDLLLEDNSEVGGFLVLHTPGHTKGSISLYTPGKLIFVGDAIYKRFALDAAQLRASLNKISKLDFDVLLPGHGDPLVSQAYTRLKDLVKHITQEK